MTSRAPASRSGHQVDQGAAGRHPVSHHGTNPATTPGASAKKTADPAAAAVLRTTPIVDPSPGLRHRSPVFLRWKAHPYPRPFDPLSEPPYPASSSAADRAVARVTALANG